MQQGRGRGRILVCYELPFFPRGPSDIPTMDEK